MVRYEFEGYTFEAYPDKNGRWCQWDDVERLVRGIKCAIADITTIVGDGPDGVQVSKVPRLFDIRDRLLEALEGNK